MECQKIGWKGRGDRNEVGMMYEGWVGRREGDREHAWGGDEGKGEGEGVNRERGTGRHDGWWDGEMERWFYTFRIITRYEKAAKPQVTVIIHLHDMYVTNSKIRSSYREAMTHTQSDKL